MTGIVTNENSFYMRTTLYPSAPRRLLELFETPSQWLTTDWLEAQHAVSGSGLQRGNQQLRCLWRDGVSVVTFDLAEMQRGCFRLDVSLDPRGRSVEIGAISNACAIAKQRLLSELEKESA